MMRTLFLALAASAIVVPVAVLAPAWRIAAELAAVVVLCAMVAWLYGRGRNRPSGPRG
jgi:membrane protein implicated in regulation of membrane protease activity